MSEGGYWPWKVQELRVAPHLDAKDYVKCLPIPPGGWYWKRHDDKNWELVEFEKQESKDKNCTVFSDSSVLSHTVMPHDTLQGLALRYRIPVSELRRFNTLPSNNVQILKTLRVPISHNQPIEPQEMTDNEVTLQRFRNETGESLEEAKFYLEESKWVLQEALQLWKEDDRYEKAKFEVDKYQKSSEIRSEIFDKFEIVQPLMVIFVD